MQASQRVVIELPLHELWDHSGTVAAERSRPLSAQDIRCLLGDGPVRFVVVDVGGKPDWVPESRCHLFWKGEVQPHLADPDQRAVLEDFPGGYCYFASEWTGPDGPPIIVLERYH